MSRVCGAGILPYFIDPQGGEIYFLLGREQHVPGWRGSSKVSAFEGGHKGGETIERNAVREFAEESMLLLLTHESELDDLERQLARGDYAMKIGVFSQQRDEQHWTYVKRFPWPGNAPLDAAFARRREALREVQGALARSAAAVVPPEGRYPFLRRGDRVEWGAAAGPTPLADARVARRADHFVTIEYAFAHGASRRVTFPRSEQMDAYAQSLDDEAVLRARVGALPPLLARKAVAGAKPRVSNEWLEKQSVALYSLPQLQQMLRRNPDEFRAYFLIVIRQVMQQFAAPSPPGAVVSVRDTYG